jgi:hypothetical protein
MVHVPMQVLLWCSNMNKFWHWGHENLPSSEFTAEVTENTKELNQNVFTAMLRGPSLLSKAIWIPVAILWQYHNSLKLLLQKIIGRQYIPVTADTKIARVDRLLKVIAFCFCASRAAMTPASTKLPIDVVMPRRCLIISPLRSRCLGRKEDSARRTGACLTVHVSLHCWVVHELPWGIDCTIVQDCYERAHSTYLFRNPVNRIPSTGEQKREIHNSKVS